MKRRVDLTALAHLLWLYHEAAATPVEWATARQNNGAASMFSFGYTLACCMAVLTTIGIEIVTFSPQDWHKLLNIPASIKAQSREAEKKDGKTANRDLAARQHPAQARLFRRVKDHDRADATLIGHTLLTYLQK